jgi:hypothetical protein
MWKYKMDEYILHRDNTRANDYYQIMGNLEIRALLQETLIASNYLKNVKVKQDFINNLSLFIEHQKEIINNESTPDKKLQAIRVLKQERRYLSDQVFKLKYKQVSLMILLSLDIIDSALETPLYYFVKGIGIVSGALQIQTGIGLIGGGYVTGPGAVIGNIAGITLVIHGLGAIQENFTAIINGNRTYKGYLRKGYESAAQHVGLTSAQGDIIYGGVDLLLSTYTLSRSVLKPEKNRLYYYMYDDTVFGFRNMTNRALKIEIGIDGLTIKSMSDSLQPVTIIIPFPFPKE